MDAEAVFRAVALQAKRNYVEGVRAAAPRFRALGITTPIRIAHFLAQMLHETGGGTVLFESLTYTTTRRLMEIFGIGHHSAAITLAEAPGLLRNPRALGDRVYGLGNPKKARELGNTKPGDGFLYRGGGALQTTGRAAYRRMGQRISVDLEAHPELIVDPAHAFAPGLEEWNDRQLNPAADANDIRRITRAINGGFNGLEDRKRWFRKLWKVASGGLPVPPFKGE